MSKLNYVLVNADILPEIYSKVLAAKEFLASGERSEERRVGKECM